MPKIENYQIKTSPLTAQDKWIGTDSAGNITKNFTPKGIADFINETDLVTVAGQSLFKWQNSAGPRETGSISYVGFGGDGDPLGQLNAILISDSNYGKSLVIDYLNTLVNKNIIFVQVDQPNNFLVAKVSSIVPNAVYPTFNTLAITALESNGVIVGDAQYALAVYPGAPPIPLPGTNGDAFYEHDQTLPKMVWSVTHNLNKKPSVHAVDTADEEVEGAVVYVNDNVLTITFNSVFAGKAYIN
jgi:hypothetical protein|tara:strand:- start:410 stop:1138 length:729 start_codon:yes stop_codon:yes gene_type:complete